tara:strand:+ start:308 stop:571 length:264 start_codon:yes stop_codon:yes gene_type:complete
MKGYIYKILIASIAAVLVFKLTIGQELNQINDKFNYILTSDGRKGMIESLKEEIGKANNKENYLDEEEKILLRNFIKKIRKELELDN